MKKLFYLIQIIFLFCIVGCAKEDPNQDQPPHNDWASVGRYIWENNSDHTIMVTVFGEFEDELLSPGGRIVKEKDNLGSTIIHFHTYVRKGMSIIFDDGPYGGVFDENDVNNDPQPSPRDWKNCEYEEIEEPDPGIYYKRMGIWTYTFTNADYDAAVARGPMTEQ